MTLTVTNPPPVINAGADKSGAEGSAMALDATVTDTDPVTTKWTATAGAGVDAGATCTFANPDAVDTTVTCTDDGTWTLTLTGNDGTNSDVSDSMTLTVTNAVPTVTITAPTLGATSPTGVPVTLTATTGDPGSNDTRTCSIAWGDGSTGPGTMSAGTCSGTHSYTAAGSPTITVTVTDDDGGVATATRSITVTSTTTPPPTPEKLKVTGGGWLKKGDDKVKFAFVAKSKGTAFAGKLNVRFQKDKFKGKTVSSLSVSGKTATWSGTGLWNGKKGYTFTVEVVDAAKKSKKDSFSITIKSSNGSTAFTVTGSIQKGQIVIH